MAQSLIVHPTDLKPVSEGAFHHALRVGIAARARLTLVHVLEGGARPTDIDAFPRVRETLIQWGLLASGASQADVGEALGLLVSKGEISAADGEAALVRMLREREARMIVVGTRALDGLQRLGETSFSEAVSRDARVPTLFVPIGAKGFVDAESGGVSLRNVLVPIAETPDPSGAIAAAKGLCEMFGQPARIHLLHVGRAHEAPPVRVALGPERVDHVRQGPLVETIVELADELDAELIVMATAGHKGFLDALRGSTTEGVLRKARRALLAAPSH